VGVRQDPVGELVRGFRSGDVLALARAISSVEDDRESASAILRALYPQTGRAHIVGITGPPGAGKSTLCDQLIGHWRKEGLRVAVLAIDPSSPFSGGAILGDRIRMMDRSTDEGVYIRSMATRGWTGGLARAAADAADLLDAFGFDVVLIETIGVGQDEVEVARVAPVTVLVLTPGAGDDIQAIKAGILEIADIYVVNKAEGPDADRVVRNLMGLFSLVDEPARPVVRTVAIRGEGIAELAVAVEERRKAIEGDEAFAAWRRSKVERRLQLLLRDRLQRELEALPGGMAPYVEKVLRGEMDPHAAAEALWAERLG